MEKRELLNKLNRLYSFALEMMDLYAVQSKNFAGSYESIVFERLANIEEQHTVDIADKIEALGGQPTKLDELITPIMKLSDQTDSLEDILKADILIGRIIMSVYTDLINSVGDEYGTELKNILQHNLGDEDVQTAWFNQRLADYDNLDFNTDKG